MLEAYNAWYDCVSSVFSPSLPPNMCFLKQMFLGFFLSFHLFSLIAHPLFCSLHVEPYFWFLLLMCIVALVRCSARIVYFLYRMHLYVCMKVKSDRFFYCFLTVLLCSHLWPLGRPQMTVWEHFALFWRGYRLDGHGPCSMYDIISYMVHGMCHGPYVTWGLKVKPQLLSLKLNFKV